LTADILEKQKRFEQALAHWRALRNAVPDDREVHWRLARNYAALGRPDAANEALREYLLFDLTDEERSEAERFQARLSALSRRSL
jgi:tetratricopeptide (TPR) repeat protein